MSPPDLVIAIQDVSGHDGVPARARIRSWAAYALAGDIRGELTIRIVSASESAALNERYRGKSGPTNVLAFPSDVLLQAPNGELLPVGDLVICAEVVAREAGEQAKSLDAHWAHIVVHGALHLVGYDHDATSAAQVMEARERALLADLGFADPYSVTDEVHDRIRFDG